MFVEGRELKCSVQLAGGRFQASRVRKATPRCDLNVWMDGALNPLYILTLQVYLQVLGTWFVHLGLNAYACSMRLCKFQ